jgi:hypothetical protein
MQIDATLLYIKFVKNPVVPDSQFKLRATFQSLVRKT